MSFNPFDETINALADLGGQRVWSLMVTIFGDLAQSKGSTIEGPVLSAILADMDIRPEAVRVALHRLRNDGWIASSKTGRTSLHSLTEVGRAQSAAASWRIYAKPGLEGPRWQLAILEDATTVTRNLMLDHGFAPLMSRVYIGGAHATAPVGSLVLPGDAVPDWLCQQFAPEDLAQDYAALYRVLSRAEQTLTDPGMLIPRQVAVLRCLVVHNWRRIVLKHPDLPPALFPTSWDGPRCQELVHTLLTRFVRPDLGTILRG